MRRETVVLTSDLSGKDGAETRVLHLHVEMELTADEYKTIELVLSKYRAKGRPVGRPGAKPAGSRGTRGWREKMEARAASMAMRAWLREYGYRVPEKGVIRQELVDAYNNREPSAAWKAEQKAHEQAIELDQTVRDVKEQPGTTAVGKALADAVLRTPQSAKNPPSKAAPKAPQRAVAARKTTTPKVTVVAPSKATAKAATTANVVGIEPPKTVKPRRSRAKTTVPPLEFKS